MSVWDNEYYEDEPDGYGSDPESVNEEPGEDPDHDRKCDTCGSKYCEGECEPLLIPNSTILPDTDEDWGGGFARNH